MLGRTWESLYIVAQRQICWVLHRGKVSVHAALTSPTTDAHTRPPAAAAWCG